MKVALVHDYLSEYGGAERVVEALHEMWPEAPLYTAFVDWKRLGKHADRFKNWDIRPSWVQRFPIIQKFISPLRFIAPWIWESFDLSEYDVVVTSSGWFMCRGVKAGKRENKSWPMQICYIHHPPRNLYGYATGSNLQKYWPVKIYSTIINFFLRNYDFQTAQKVDYFIANSKETERRVEKFYRRESTVIYPPIDTQDFRTIPGIKEAPIPGMKSSHTRACENPIQGPALKKSSLINSKFEYRNPKQYQNLKVSNNKTYYLSVGRLSWAKRVDIIIQACNTLHLPLKIVGVGKEEEELKKIAGPTIEFLGSVSDAELAVLYTNAKALIFCALDEDFGMVPVEAMAYGTPVIGLAQGGVKETVIDKKTGILFDKPTVESLVTAMNTFEKLFNGKNWSEECSKQAHKFSKTVFKKKMYDIMGDIQKRDA